MTEISQDIRPIVKPNEVNSLPDYAPSSCPHCGAPTGPDNNPVICSYCSNALRKPDSSDDREVSDLELPVDELDDKPEEVEKPREKVYIRNLEVPPLPEYITPRVENALKAMGFKFVYLPKLDIGDLEELKKVGAEKFLNDLAAAFPDWTPPGISFWELVESGELDFPVSQSGWLVNRDPYTYQVDNTQYIESGVHTHFAMMLNFVLQNKKPVDINTVHKMIEDEVKRGLFEKDVPKNLRVRSGNPLEISLIKSLGKKVTNPLSLLNLPNEIEAQLELLLSKINSENRDGDHRVQGKEVYEFAVDAKNTLLAMDEEGEVEVIKPENKDEDYKNLFSRPIISFA